METHLFHGEYYYLSPLNLVLYEFFGAPEGGFPNMTMAKRQSIPENVSKAEIDSDGFKSL